MRGTTRSLRGSPSACAGRLLGLSLAAGLLLGGCGTQIGSAGKGSLRIESRQHDKIDVGSSFDVGFFSMDEKNAITVVLIEGEPDNPSAAMTVRMFWLPRVGATPIDRTATNASVNYIVFGPSLSSRGPAADRTEVGVYSGAGFLYLNSDPSARQLRAGIWEANIQLSDGSLEFIDQIGPSLLTGSVRATRDDQRVDQLIRKLSQHTTSRLGYVRLVSAE